MIPEEQSDHAMERDLRNLGQQSGPCPTMEELTALHAGELGAPRKTSVQDHIAVCGVCDLMLTRMQAADEIVQSDLPKNRSKQWIRGFWKPTVAYAVAAGCLAITLWVGLVRNADKAAIANENMPPITLAPPIQEARVFELSQSRAGDQADIRLSDGQGSFILGFFVPVRPGHFYRASIIGTSGGPLTAPVMLSTPSTTGSFHLVLQQEVFPEGSYQIVVEEAKGESVIQSFGIPFRVIR